VAKRKRRMSKEELQAPDQVEVALARVWDVLNRYKLLIIGGIAALILLGVVIWIVNATSKASSEERSLALKEGSAALWGHVGELPDFIAVQPGPRPPVFGDHRARLTAAQAGLEKYLEAYGSDRSVEAVDIARANVKLGLGDADGALALIDAWRAQRPRSPLLPTALEVRARALIAKGDRAAAAEALTEAAAASSGTLKAELLRRLGDLENPLMGAGGDPKKARAAYEEALAAVGGELPGEPAEFFAPTPGLAGELELRLKLLP